MGDFNIWTPPRRGRTPKNPFDIGLGTPPEKNVGRDSRRSFTQSQRKELWAQQNGKCAKCHRQLDIRTVEHHHIKPWADKGRTITTNGAALCAECHKLENHKENVKKADRKKKQPRENNPFGGNLFSPPKRGRGNNPFGFRL